MECLWNECKQKFDSAEKLKDHLEKHDFSELKCYWEGCNRFGETQPSKYAITAHVKKHSGDRPYKCKECPKSYTRGDALSKHMKYHKLGDKEIEALLNNVVFLKKKIEILEKKLIVSKFNRELAFKRMNVCSKNFIEIVREELKNKFQAQNFEQNTFWSNFFKNE